MRVNDPATAISGGDAGAEALPAEDAAASGPVTGKRSELGEESPEGDQDDEHRQKRSRGRPRLDTKDETAADVSLDPTPISH